MACGTPFNPGLTLPITYSNFAISNPGTPSAFMTIDSNDAFFNGAFDDTTTATANFGGTVISFNVCGGVAPSVSLVSRSRITLAIPGIVSNCDAYVGIQGNWTSGLPVYFKCGASSGPPPTPACVLTAFPAQSTSVAGCTVPVLP